MVWIGWIGEPGATTKQVITWADGYWSGRSTADLKTDANPSWEWLFACPLRVVE